VLVLFTDASLIQRSGRGSIFGQAFKELSEVTDAVNVVLPLSDVFGAKGYVGGPAELCLTAIYEDPSLGTVAREKCVEIRLKVRRNRSLLSPGRARRRPAPGGRPPGPRRDLPVGPVDRDRLLLLLRGQPSGLVPWSQDELVE
jgi:hypothetical protein